MNGDPLCDCGYPERKAKNLAAWKETPRGLAFSTSSWPPYPVWHTKTCAALDAYPLVDIGTMDACPKCRSTVVKTTYHEADWHYQAHHHDYWRTDLGTWSCKLTWAYRPVEHLDRDCQTCGWGWLEAVAS